MNSNIISISLKESTSKQQKVFFQHKCLHHPLKKKSKISRGRCCSRSRKERGRRETEERNGHWAREAQFPEERLDRPTSDPLLARHPPPRPPLSRLPSQQPGFKKVLSAPPPPDGGEGGGGGGGGGRGGGGGAFSTMECARVCARPCKKVSGVMPSPPPPPLPLLFLSQPYRLYSSSQ